MLLQIWPCLFVIWKTWCGAIPISGVGFHRKERKAKMSGRCFLILCSRDSS